MEYVWWWCLVVAYIYIHLYNITTLVVTKLDDNSFLLKLPMGVELPTGAYYTDIRLSTNGTVVNSDIIQINVKDVVTDV